MGQTNEFAHRMSRKTIKLVDTSGNPVAGKEVALKQTNHISSYLAAAFLMQSK
ncbi:hypothetical protein [Bacillus sp. ISL-18]|uniref:hypothetical protein n=1 Tax=Bacillus sp. ISL-18 TaxID=2819118 RepID=UPI0020352887|nr:hypothetical protein [Bacillus sp. ISL-18]